jgi:hypothetical protein
MLKLTWDNKFRAAMDKKSGTQFQCPKFEFDIGRRRCGNVPKARG